MNRAWIVVLALSFSLVMGCGKSKKKRSSSGEDTHHRKGYCCFVWFPVPVLYDGPWTDDLPDILGSSIDPKRQEGFVLRLADGEPYPDGPGDAGRFRGGGGWEGGVR